jgi:N6-L-threonylcarbamoyladenine synthase
LQAELEKLTREQGIPFLRAQPQHTGDNATMIAFAAWVEREAGAVNEGGYAVEIAPSLPLALAHL